MNFNDTLTSTGISLLFTRDQIKDRCIDDVGIPHSFVSRNYVKNLSSCTTIFCFSKFDIAHDLVQALCSTSVTKFTPVTTILFLVSKICAG